MNSFTFSLTVTDQVAGSEPMSEQAMIDYILLRLESQSVVTVLNIVRDYQVGNFGTYLVQLYDNRTPESTFVEGGRLVAPHP